MRWKAGLQLFFPPDPHFSSVSDGYARRVNGWNSVEDLKDDLRSAKIAKIRCNEKLQREIWFFVWEMEVDEQVTRKIAIVAYDTFNNKQLNYLHHCLLFEQRLLQLN